MLNYKEQLRKAIELKLDPSSLLIANEMDFQLDEFRSTISEKDFNHLCSVVEECYINWDECDISHTCYTAVKLYADDKISPEDITEDLISENY